jgi:hypothetical protein
LSKAELKFRSLLEAAPDAMIISTDDGSIALVNSQAEVMFGLQREDLIGQDIRLLVPAWSGRSIATPASPRELLARRGNSLEFPVEISLSPLQTEEGLLLTSAIRDITERKRADEEIRELNTSLERRVAQRTQELLQSNEALRQSNDDLNQFAYAASHDLQEPLRMVALFSQMLHSAYMGQLGKEADEYISYVVGGAQRMEQLLKDLLAYSQAGSPDEGPLLPVDCGETIKQVLLNLKASIEESGASVTWSDLPTIPAQEVRLVQLLQNLIGNAIKYRSSDSPKIHISACSRDTEWLFSVEDNGIGIPHEYAQQIFGVFKRLHDQTYPGTGIGLAICQRIVERYGGRIWLERSAGPGSQFCFTLPALASGSP